jgi:nucleoside-triphosphatase THEP1
MILVLSGPVHAGKTSLIKTVIKELPSVNIKPDGFYSNSKFENNELVGYDLFDLKREKSFPFIVKSGEKNWQKSGQFFFIPEALKKAKEIISRGKDADVLVVDEIGPLELTGQGIWPSLKKVFFPPSTKFLLVVRENIIKNFKKLLGDNQMEIFYIGKTDTAGNLCKKILSNLKSESL